MARKSHVIGLLLAFAVVGVFTDQVMAQTYPQKPITLVMGWPAGGPTDAEARVIAQKLSESMGQPVVVLNKPGAGGNIAMGYVAKAKPDGYTILYSQTSLTTNPSLYTNMPFDAVKDFAPITQTALRPNLLTVHSSLPIKSVKELIAYAKANPGKLNFGSSGNATTGYLAGELFKIMTGVNIEHIPYKGGALVLVDLLSGAAHLSFNIAGTAMPGVKDGRLRPLSVCGIARSSLLPEIPTISESGVPGYNVSSWSGMLFPAGTSKEIITKLHFEIVKVLKKPDVVKIFNGMGAEIVGSTPEEFSSIIKEEIPKWAKVIKQSGAKLD